MRDILAINTGGTISMADGPNGLVPASGLVEAAFSLLAPAAARLNVVSFTPLVDSADFSSEQWNRLIELIMSRRYDGVVIVHGTDTMSYTCAALSYALEGIDLPVVFTGSMQPLGIGQNAEENLRFALRSAASGPPGVWLAFDGRLLCARRLVKHHSIGPASFRETDDQSCQQQFAQFRPRRFLPRRLAILTLSPGVCVAAIDAALRQLEGAVLRVFGTGTLMHSPELLRTFADATSRGCRIVAVSSCENGGLVPGAYAAGALLWKSGVKNGGRLTPEAALVRLWLELSE
ncbi:asparaginase domain-containing protein [Bradyrhizobium xenonodulans]|uniref:Asparaginase domain-containing protein n=1 Tax=Bradyrhizobium xenonodulans TaxID=2736875 RepID=A0ABY7MGQ2_9BRAD|nr:asparaginase domain-containing protein [Bradyrhizobium xenonodulans]WBL76764.1 asparaginase domain-containing protein [Bradyrhizobium xenonodulans]